MAKSQSHIAALNRDNRRSDESTTKLSITKLLHNLNVSDFVCSLTEENIIYYMCGYLIRKFQTDINTDIKFRCNINTCHIENLQNRETNILTTNQCFIYLKDS